MPAQFSERSALPAAPAAVFTVLTDPAFLAARAEHTGAAEHTAAVTTEREETVITSARTVSTTGLPAAAARFLGGTAVVEQVERWGPAAADGSRDGSLTLTVRGAPVELRGRARLCGDGATGSVHELSGTLTVRVPLLGGSVEQAALPGLVSLVRSEVDLARQWLQRP